MPKHPVYGYESEVGKKRTRNEIPKGTPYEERVHEDVLKKKRSWEYLNDKDFARIVAPIDTRKELNKAMREKGFLERMEEYRFRRGKKKPSAESQKKGLE